MTMTPPEKTPVFSTLIVEHFETHVALVRLNRPESLNALSQKVMDELVEAFTLLDHDPNVRCVVLTGNERVFAAGADISEMDGQTAADMLQGYRFNQWRRLKEFPKPIIAAVQGMALGGGLELAMLCDIAIAGQGAKLGQPEIHLGLMPGAGGTQRLTRTIGKSLAMEVILGVRTLTAQEALQAGLVSRVVPAEACVDVALEMAAKIAERAPLAVQLAKKSALKAFETSLEMGLESERHLFYLLFSTDDQKEGISAFLEKRKPHWKGH